MAEGGDGQGPLMDFWDHTDELARRLRVALYAVIASTIAFMALPSDPSSLLNPLELYDPLVGLVLRAIRSQILPPDVTLIGLELTAPITLYLMASLILGIAVSSPIAAYEIYKFIDPALYPHERRAVYPFLISFSALFSIGAAFGYWILAPFLMRATFPFFSIVGAAKVISVMDFYGLVLTTMLISGLAFTSPAFIVLLVKFGVMGTEAITRNRAYVYAALFIAAAVLTPDGGPLGDLILFIPLIALLEAGVLIARRYEGRGGIRGPRWPSRWPHCKFCGAEVPPGAAFCPACDRAQR